MTDLPGVEVTGEAGVSEALYNLGWQVVLQLLAGFPKRHRALARFPLHACSACAHAQPVPAQQQTNI